MDIELKSSFTKRLDVIARKVYLFLRKTENDINVDGLYNGTVIWNAYHIGITEKDQEALAELQYVMGSEAINSWIARIAVDTGRYRLENNTLVRTNKEAA